MKDLLEREIRRFVLESGENWSEKIMDRYFDEPVIKYASANDPLFTEYKSIIGNDHLTPREFFELEFGPGSYHGGTVISIVLPVGEKIRKSNRQQREQPSWEWSLFNMYDSLFLKSLANHITDYLTHLNYRTVCPVWNCGGYRVKAGASNWSERHVAYAAGQGTFSIHEGLITEKGSAIRCLSLITELELTPDIRTAKNYMENCLFMSRGICGACIKRCPANAISVNGHDKTKCWNAAYGERARELAVSYGGDGKQVAGCALCQTNVPCEYRNPLKTLESLNKIG